LAILGQSKILKTSYLAGGTAAALYLGHRISVDFDFFTNEPFDSEIIKTGLEKLGRFELDRFEENTIWGYFNEVKFSLFLYKYPRIAKGEMFEGVDIVSCEDILAMKLAAICTRATKKDFIDIYYLVQKYFSFEQGFDFYDKKFGQLENNKFTVLRSMQYFGDVDESEMPKMLVELDWDKLKDFFQKETIRLAKSPLFNI